MSKSSKTKVLKPKGNKKESFVNKFIPVAVIIAVVIALNYIAISALLNHTKVEPSVFYTIFLGGAASVVIVAIQFHSIKQVVKQFRK